MTTHFWILFLRIVKDLKEEYEGDEEYEPEEEDEEEEDEEEDSEDEAEEDDELDENDDEKVDDNCDDDKKENLETFLSKKEKLKKKQECGNIKIFKPKK